MKRSLYARSIEFLPINVVLLRCTASICGCMFVCVCMYVCMYMCMYVCIYICVCTYVCMYVCMYVCIYGNAVTRTGLTGWKYVAADLHTGGLW